MPRKGPVQKRSILPDPIHKSRLVARFINGIMYSGKKSIAEKIIYKALNELEEKTGMPALKALEQAIENVKPKVEVKPRRVGGSTYQVPIEVAPDRQYWLATLWLILYARKRSEKEMSTRVAAELLEAFHGRGASVKKKEETHKVAEANRPFAHFRW